MVCEEILRGTQSGGRALPATPRSDKHVSRHAINMSPVTALSPLPPERPETSSPDVSGPYCPSGMCVALVQSLLASGAFPDPSDRTLRVAIAGLGHLARGCDLQTATSPAQGAP